MPMSPWMASAGCRKRAGLPVEVMVAAILRPISPDLPMPVTTTWPRHWKRRSTAVSNSLSIRSRAFKMALASVSRTFFPVSILPISRHYTTFAGGLKGAVVLSGADELPPSERAFSGLGMDLQKDAVGAGHDAGGGHERDELRVAARNAGRRRSAAAPNGWRP